jgi:glucose-6-phosphate isomerase
MEGCLVPAIGGSLLGSMFYINMFSEQAERIHFFAGTIPSEMVRG